MTETQTTQPADTSDGTASEAQSTLQRAAKTAPVKEEPAAKEETPKGEEAKGKDEGTNKEDWEQKYKSLLGVHNKTVEENKQLKNSHDGSQRLQEEVQALRLSVADLASAHLEALASGDEESAEVLAKRQFDRQVASLGLAQDDPLNASVQAIRDAVNSNEMSGMVAMKTLNKIVLPAMKKAPASTATQPTNDQDDTPNQPQEPTGAISEDALEALFGKFEERLTKKFNLDGRYGGSGGGSSVGGPSSNPLRSIIDEAKAKAKGG